jgi:hypothetical protein
MGSWDRSKILKKGHWEFEVWFETWLIKALLVLNHALEKLTTAYYKR